MSAFADTTEYLRAQWPIWRKEYDEERAAEAKKDEEEMARQAMFQAQRVEKWKKYADFLAPEARAIVNRIWQYVDAHRQDWKPAVKDRVVRCHLPPGIVLPAPVQGQEPDWAALQRWLSSDGKDGPTLAKIVGDILHEEYRAYLSFRTSSVLLFEGMTLSFGSNV